MNLSSTTKPPCRAEAQPSRERSEGRSSPASRAEAWFKAGQIRTNPDGFAPPLQFRPAVPEQSEGGSQAQAGEIRTNPDGLG